MRMHFGVIMSMEQFVVLAFLLVLACVWVFVLTSAWWRRHS
jgi:hypothetical protein